MPVGTLYIPPEEVTLKGDELEAAPWKTEHDVLRTLAELGHEAMPLASRTSSTRSATRS